MARPRLISDETIIAKAYELLMERGASGLTFETLGAQVGLVPAALVRRFKNKQELILQIDRYALERTSKKLAEAMDETSSPVEAIIAQFTAELGFASTLEKYANGQEFLLMDFRQKVLYDNYQMSFEQRHQQVIELLQKAQAQGELSKIDDIPELARHLEVILHGAGHVWAMTQENTIEDTIRRHVELALKPYRKPKGAHMMRA
jgi:AcrR family transcriptional regulator